MRSPLTTHHSPLITCLAAWLLLVAAWTPGLAAPEPLRVVVVNVPAPAEAMPMDTVPVAEQLQERLEQEIRRQLDFAVIRRDLPSDPSASLRTGLDDPSPSAAAAAVGRAERADAVLLLAVCCVPSPQPTLTVTAAVYNVAREELFVSPVLPTGLADHGSRITDHESQTEVAAFLESATDGIVAYLRQVWGPTGMVTAVLAEKERTEVRLKMLAVGGSAIPFPRLEQGARYAISCYTGPVRCAETGENLGFVPQPAGQVEITRAGVGSATPSQREGGDATEETWAVLEETGNGRRAVPLRVGERVLLSSPEAPPPVEEPAWTLLLTSRPLGAAVFLDGQFQGITPLRLPLPPDAPGELRLTRAGFQPWTKTLEAPDRARGLLGVRLTPEAEAVATEAQEEGFSVRVSSVPEQAQVLLDEVALGTAPVVIEKLQGRHTLTVRQANHRDWQLQLEPRGDLSIIAKLTPLAGRLTVTSQPAGATVYLDGVELGRTPVEAAAVAVGERTLVLRHPGYQHFGKKITVVEGRTTRVEAALTEQGAVGRAAPNEAGPSAPIPPAEPSPEPILNKQFTLRTHPAGAVVDARLTITTVGEETRIVFLFSRPVRHQPHAESLPNRVFWIDFHGVKLRPGITVDLPHPVLKRVRVALFSDPDSIVRAAFTVAPGYRATVQPTGDAKQVVMVVKK